MTVVQGIAVVAAVTTVAFNLHADLAAHALVSGAWSGRRLPPAAMAGPRLDVARRARPPGRGPAPPHLPHRAGAHHAYGPAGTEPHELAFLPGGGEVPLTPEGSPDEDELARRGAFELEAFGPGQSCSATYDLAPGSYTVFCIVESPDGQTHLDKRMKAALRVG